MLLKWMNWIYQDIKAFYTFSTMLIVIAIGLYMSIVDYQSLKGKKLKRDGKICRFIGLAYLFGGIGLFVFLKIF